MWMAFPEPRSEVPLCDTYQFKVTSCFDVTVFIKTFNDNIFIVTDPSSTSLSQHNKKYGYLCFISLTIQLLRTLKQRVTIQNSDV